MRVVHEAHGFKPNVFVNIKSYFDCKIAILKMYNVGFGDFPFPRSEQTAEL